MGNCKIYGSQNGNLTLRSLFSSTVRSQKSWSQGHITYPVARPRNFGGMEPSLASRVTRGGICAKPMRQFWVLDLGYIQSSALHSWSKLCVTVLFSLSGCTKVYRFECQMSNIFWDPHMVRGLGASPQILPHNSRYKTLASLVSGQARVTRDEEQWLRGSETQMTLCRHEGGVVMSALWEASYFKPVTGGYARPGVQSASLFVTSLMTS